MCGCGRRTIWLRNAAIASGVSDFHARQIHELQIRRFVRPVPKTFHRHANQFAMQRQKFRDVRRLAIQPPDAHSLLVEQNRRGHPFAKRGRLARTRRADENMRPPRAVITCRAARQWRQPVAHRRPFFFRRRQRIFAVQQMKLPFQLIRKFRQQPHGFKPFNAAPAARSRFFDCRFDGELIAGRNSKISVARRNFLLMFWQRFGNARGDFHLPVFLPEPGNSLARQFPHAHHDGFRAELSWTCVQRCAGILAVMATSFMPVQSWE